MCDMVSAGRNRDKIIMIFLSLNFLYILEGEIGTFFKVGLCQLMVNNNA